MSADFYFFPYHTDSGTTRLYLREPVLGDVSSLIQARKRVGKFMSEDIFPKNLKFQAQETETQQSRLKPIQNNSDFFISCWKGFQWKEKQLV